MAAIGEAKITIVPELDEKALAAICDRITAKVRDAIAEGIRCGLSALLAADPAEPILKPGVLPGAGGDFQRSSDRGLIGY